MIDKRIIDFVSKKKDIPQRDLIEKDILLTEILYYLSMDSEFFKDYALKGGTCLAKFYFGYFRFSEDLDFTYLNQDKFKDKTNTQIRRIISEEADKTAKLLEDISLKMKLRFKADKRNEEYFEFGGGNKFMTFKIWYDSIELGRESFIKIQVNYKEKILFEIEDLNSKGLVSKDLEKEFSVNFPDPILSFKVKAYGLREILCEKVRAILTRRGVKARDFIDVFMIEKKGNLNVEDFEEEILEKTRDSLENKKYLQNLKEKAINLPSYAKGEEERLLLIKLDKEFYDSFLKRFNKFLNKIIQKIK